MVSFELNDTKKIGIGLTGFGVFFSFLGIIFFFDKGLLAMGNILFIAGLMLTIGLKSTMLFFAKPKNYKGTISFGVGFFLLLIGWPFFGMILEAYGFIVLFSSSSLAEASNSWVDFSAACRDIVLYWLQRKACTCVITNSGDKYLLACATNAKKI
ncbi:vesicle transport protein GOT1 isoform X1 [Dendrobium catenatum]|uniref:vesicle transport protein GOT1 isoform X1 n=1 Tax=Dendrobium catenatum TaxID=906689 RepID=UPI0009F2C5F1|nr:vesicle transport protein GOT1 isoform X1 [Dendrobium catenatum]XP_028549884.1 vesicle transport protein GOT1 isoform X1 [Dendrobium catenatum]